MKLALRHVVGSEGEREFLWMKSVALRVWNGCSIVFFTLNPHDIWSPLLVVFCNGETWQREKISLDWGDDKMREFYEDAKIGNPLIFHKLAAQDPCAAAKAVHRTFRMTLELLFNCSTPANCKKNALYADGHPCRCEPGLIGYILGYIGMVEPQMRFTEHIHMLMQVLGFSHPRDFFRGRRFVDMFRRVWAFVASISFRSLEGLARSLGSDSAMTYLQKAPLMTLSKSQLNQVGLERAAETAQAQLTARGHASSETQEKSKTNPFMTWCREVRIGRSALCKTLSMVLSSLEPHMFATGLLEGPVG